ncbi:MAG: SCO family protein [Luteimonas sp.]
MKRFRPALACLLLAAAGACAAQTPLSLPKDSVYQLPLKLTDQHGKSWDWRGKRGKPQLVAMFYTSCPYICPLIVDSGKAVEHALAPAERARLGILLISMDPKRDNPAALMAVVIKRKLDPARWSLASPKPNDVRGVSGVLGVRYRAVADGGFNHTSALVLLDREGRIVARTEKIGSRVDAEFMVAVRAALTPLAKGRRSTQRPSQVAHEQGR